MISDGIELDNRSTAGQEAVDRGNWRLAYDCFRDCWEYLKYYEPWREDDIAYYEKLVERCKEMIR